MSNHEMLLFGSFTEDEAKLFQNQSAQKSHVGPSEKAGPQLASANIDLQLESLDVGSLNSVKGLRTESILNASIVKSKDIRSPSLATKDIALSNKKPSVVNGIQKTAKAQANGIPKSCSPMQHHTTTSVESSRDISVRNFIANNAALGNGKLPVNNDLQHASIAQANGTCNSGSPASVISANGVDALDLNLICICKNKLDNVETPLVNQTLTDRSADADDGFEGSKDTNKLNDTSTVVKPAVDIRKKLNKDAPPSEILLPRGLINLGNLCFFNATLQALLSCSPFVQLLQDIADHNIPKAGYPTLLSFVGFISDFGMPADSNAKNHKRRVIELGKPFRPSMFIPVLNMFTPDVPSSISGRPRQEDAQEFLSFVMDQMHDELLKLEGHLSSSNGERLPVVSSSEDDGWETVGPKNKSALTRTQSFTPSKLSAIFGGQLRSVVKSSGSKPSATVQPFLLLHLDILPNAVHSIEDALHLFSASEALEGYKASTGKDGVVSASKSVKMQKLPKILILHLMRFSYGSKGSTKLHKPVHFPPELVLTRDLLVNPSSEGRKYELVATITHHGEVPSTGHYTAYSRYSNGQWLRYDDSSVTSVGINKVLHDQAYIVFYKQV